MSQYTYMVTNNINGKVYVGSHSWKGEGLDPNYYGSGTAITRAVQKYGKEHFQVEVLYFYDTVEECRKDEERILTEYNVKDCPHSYNCKNSAVGFTSEDMTDEIRQKISQANKGKTISDATRQKISQAHKGRTLSDEHRKKLSQTLKGRTISDATRQKISQTLKRITASEEYRKKLSKAMTGENNHMYGKRGKDSPNYGKHRTDEHRRKLSQVQNDKKIPVVAIQIDTGKVKIFESQMECARKLNVNHSHICNCLKGKRKAHKGYTFKYLEQLESGIYEGITELALEPSKIAPTPVIAIQKDTGRVRMFKSQLECSRVLGVNSGNVSSCLKGRQKTCKGYIIKYLKRCSTDYKITKRKAKKTEKIKLTTKIKGTTPIIAIQKDTGKIRMFESLMECARQLNLSPGNIHSCLKGRRKTTGGYTFKYIEQLDSGIYEGIL